MQKYATLTETAKAEVIAGWEASCHTPTQREAVQEFKRQCITTPPPKRTAKTLVGAFTGFMVQKAKALMAKPKWVHTDGTLAFRDWLKEIGELLDLIAGAAEAGDKALSDYFKIESLDFTEKPYNPEETEEQNDYDLPADNSGLISKALLDEGVYSWGDPTLIEEIENAHSGTTCQQFINGCTSPAQLLELALFTGVPECVWGEAKALTKSMGSAEAMDFLKGDYNFTGCIISYLNA